MEEVRTALEFLVDTVDKRLNESTSVIEASSPDEKILEKVIGIILETSIKDLITEEVSSILLIEKERRNDSRDITQYVQIPDRDVDDAISNIEGFEENNRVLSNLENPPHSELYEKLWNERKSALEKEAERNARIKAKQWQREKISLKKIIDDSLKEYIDLYEKAHSLYLQFEYEKSEWMNKVKTQMIVGKIFGSIVILINLTGHESLENDLFQYEFPEEEQQGVFNDLNPNLTTTIFTPHNRKRKFMIPRKEN